MLMSRPMLLLTTVASLLGLVREAGACSIALSVGGTLALSADATRFGSTEPGGSPATITILNLTLGERTITVAAPTLVSSPPAFNAGSAVLQVAYAGGGLLSGVTQGFTTAQTSFNVPALLSVAAIVNLNNRITSAGGFDSGTYQTRTVVTCS